MSQSSRVSLPPPRDPSTSDGASQPIGGAPLDLTHVSPEHREVLQRLHARVEQAVETIDRLRDENERLRQRVAELESRPAVPDDKTLLLMDDDREALREQIAGFIDAIDRYLDTDAPADAPPGTASTDAGAGREAAPTADAPEDASHGDASSESASAQDASHEMNGTASVSGS